MCHKAALHMSTWVPDRRLRSSATAAIGPPATITRRGADQAAAPSSGSARPWASCGGHVSAPCPATRRTASPGCWARCNRWSHPSCATRPARSQKPIGHRPRPGTEKGRTATGEGIQADGQDRQTTLGHGATTPRRSARLWKARASCSPNGIRKTAGSPRRSWRKPGQACTDHELCSRYGVPITLDRGDRYRGDLRNLRAALHASAEIVKV